MSTLNIAIFASGSGTNAEKIIEKFSTNSEIRVQLLLSNKADAYALERARRHGVATHVFSRQEFRDTDGVLNKLQEHNIQLIVLAGFLWLIPPKFVKAFPQAIINIHPALLPKYGGKGMYGMHVHEAVVKNQETETGITIHYVNEFYDEGGIIFQEKCTVETSDTPEDVAMKVHALEHRYFPEVIEEIALKMK